MIMKKYLRITALVLGLLILASCNQKQLEQQEDKIAQLTEEIHILNQKANEKDSSLRGFVESMSQIRENLNEIKVRQNLISEETRDKETLEEDMHAQIESDLDLISELMDDNRRRLAALNQQIRDADIRVEEFETLISSLKDEIEVKVTEISLLHENMEQLNITNENLTATVHQLEEENNQKIQEIEEKTEQLNAAYYVFGTPDELQDREIIDRKGGFLGLGRTTVLSSNINDEYFNKVDITQIENVYIPGQHPSLLSLHPEGSYIIESKEDKDASMIFIEDPEKFWSNTRYLVVTIE